MNLRHLGQDERLTGICSYCGAHPDTRDHVPSKVLLDEPYPLQLPVVEACYRCNASLSLDEQYLACLIECVICGTASPTNLRRAKISRILDENPALKYRIENARRNDKSGNLAWAPETDRVRNVVLKLARGHAAYELCPQLEEPIDIAFAPLSLLNSEMRFAFENQGNEASNPWPEINSRAFHRMTGDPPDSFARSGNWIVIQPSRYRYALAEAGRVLVQMVLSEYLACQVLWE